MDEIWQDQQERENESGLDDFEAWMFQMEQEFSKQFGGKSEQTRNTDSTKAPF